MHHFNPQQRAAVQHLDSPLLVLAGAGSGKTGVITHKIAYLVQQVAIPPQHVYAVTFTNKAAREMRERCKTLLHSLADRLPIFTFHRLGLEIVRQHHQQLALRANFCIFDAHDGINLLKELMQSHEDARAKELQSLISHYKNNFIEPEEALAQNLEGASIYAHYAQRLRAYNVLDFDDLLLYPLRLFQEDAEALRHWQNQVQHLLVDEYQDTNFCQYQLMKRLLGEGAHLTVVGDDDQSIYAWRGARPENMQQLQEDFPRLSIIKLEQNYRCHRHILQAANRLIAHNPRLSDKELWSELQAGKGISVHVYADEREEAQAVVREIDNALALRRSAPGDFAILYRSNAQARFFEEALREKRLNYEISGGNSWFDHTEIRDLLAYLRLVHNPDDDAAFLRICNTPKREIGIQTVEKLSAYALKRQQSLLASATELGLAQELSERAFKNLEVFAQWMQRLQEQAANEPALSVLKSILEHIDYEAHLYDLHGDGRKVAKRLKRLEDFKHWIQRMGEEEEALQNLEQLMIHLQLRDMLSRQNDGREAVQLMTLHSAKGLEFRQVFLVGCEEELLPHANSGDSIEEERRLMYVGMTRAKEHLQISYCRQRGAFPKASAGEEESASEKKKGAVLERKPRQASRFLDELPAENVLWLDGRHDLPAAELEEFRRQSYAEALSWLRD